MSTSATSTGTEGAPAEGAPTPQATEPQALDLNEYGNYVVPVKVGGQEQFVPLTDAVSGYMMQSDYTQKTQELADARLIAEALDTDPAQAIKVLTEIYGVDLGAATEVVQEVEDSGNAIPDELQPIVSQVQEIQDRFAEQDRLAQEAQIVEELTAIETETGIPQDDLLRFAIGQNIPNLQVAASHYQATQTEAMEQHKAAKAAAETARQEAKAKASFIVGGGNAAAGASETPTAPATSFREAADRAMQQLGFK